MLRGNFRKMDGPRIDGGYVVQFDIPEICAADLMQLIALKNKMLDISWEVIEEGKSAPNPRNKRLALSQVLMDKLGWDDTDKKAYLLETFQVDSRTKLTDEQLSKFIDNLSEMTGDSPPPPEAEY